MNKKDILQQLKKHNFDLSKIRIATGGAMVLYGIREQTHDIDIGCDSDVIDYYVDKGYQPIIMKDGTRKIALGEYIELFENWAKYETVLVEGYPCITLDNLADLKKKLGREKDFKDIKLIEEYMKTHKHK